MQKLKSTIWLLGLITFLFSSCDQLDESNDVAPTTDMLVFESQKAFEDYRKQTLQVSLIERKQLEATKGFKSLGSIADELYDKVEKLSTRSQIESFVQQHPNYLQLVTNQDNEIELQTVLETSIDQYVVNQDRMYQVENQVYKVFENITIRAAIKDIQILKTLTAENYQQADIVTEVALRKKSVVTQRVLDVANDCGTSKDATRTAGNDRTKIEIDLVKFKGNSEAIEAHWRVRPQRRSFGIWLTATRTITGSMNFNVAFKSDGVWENFFVNVNRSGGVDRRWKGYGSSTMRVKIDDYHYDGYYAWGDTPSTRPIEIECNKNLICGFCNEPDPCNGVNCPPGRVCRNGSCVSLCAGVNCPDGFQCVGGNCVEVIIPIDCSTVPICPTGYSCVEGRCLPDGIEGGGIN